MKVLCALVTTVFISGIASAASPLSGPLLRVPFSVHEYEKDNGVADPIDVEKVDRLEPVELKPAFKRALRTPEDLISTFDVSLVNELQRSWRSVQNGKSTHESVILILRTVAGFQARRLPLTFEHRKATFAWHPAIVAVIHTHPNDCPARPQPDDIAIADKHRVFMFTLTDTGMYVYDPITRQTGKVIDGLLWLDEKTWENRLPVKY
jgi:hypothetical protein